jgi:hypothetical protein
VADGEDGGGGHFDKGKREDGRWEGEGKGGDGWKEVSMNRENGFEIEELMEDSDWLNYRVSNPINGFRSRGLMV